MTTQSKSLELQQKKKQTALQTIEKAEESFVAIYDKTVKFYDLLSYHDLCRQQNEYGGIASLSSDKYGVFFPDLPTWKQKFNPLQG